MSTTLKPFAFWICVFAFTLAYAIAIEATIYAINALKHYYRYGNPFGDSLIAAGTYVFYYLLFICDVSAFTHHVVSMCMLLGLVLPSPLLPATIVTSARLPKPRPCIRPQTHCLDLDGGPGIRECFSDDIRRDCEERPPSLVRPVSFERKSFSYSLFANRKKIIACVQTLPRRPCGPASALRPGMSKSTDSSTCRPAVGDSAADRCLVSQMEVDGKYPSIVREWEMEELTEQFAAMHIVHSTRDGSPSPASQQIFPLLPMDEDPSTVPSVVSGDSATDQYSHTSTTAPLEPLAWSLQDPVNSQPVADRGAGLRESSLNDGYTALSAAAQNVAGVQPVVGDSTAVLNEENNNVSASSVCDDWMDVDSSEAIASSTTSDADSEVSEDSSSDSDAGLPDEGDSSSEQQSVGYSSDTTDNSNVSGSSGQDTLSDRGANRGLATTDNTFSTDGAEWSFGQRADGGDSLAQITNDDDDEVSSVSGSSESSDTSSFRDTDHGSDATDGSSSADDDEYPPVGRQHVDEGDSSETLPVVVDGSNVTTPHNDSPSPSFSAISESSSFPPLPPQEGLSEDEDDEEEEGEDNEEEGAVVSRDELRQEALEAALYLMQDFSPEERERFARIFED